MKSKEEENLKIKKNGININNRSQEKEKEKNDILLENKDIDKEIEIENCKLQSVEFTENNQKYLEEFLQLKTLSEKLEKEKRELPIITQKIIKNDKNIKKESSITDENLNFETKFKIRGLVHEKDNFNQNAYKYSNRYNNNNNNNSFSRRNFSNNNYDNDDYKKRSFNNSFDRRKQRNSYINNNSNGNRGGNLWRKNPEF
jgi:hypothetical protein